MGSFFIPMAVMVYVYARISCVVAARHDHMTEIEVHKVIIRVLRLKTIESNSSLVFWNFFLFLLLVSSPFQCVCF